MVADTQSERGEMKKRKYSAKARRQRWSEQIRYPRTRHLEKESAIQAYATDAMQVFVASGDTQGFRTLYETIPNTPDRMAFVRWLMEVADQTVEFNRRKGTFRKSRAVKVQRLEHLIDMDRVRSIRWTRYREAPIKGLEPRDPPAHESVIFRSTTTSRDGRRLHAIDYGKRAFPIRLKRTK